MSFQPGVVNSSNIQEKVHVSLFAKDLRNVAGWDKSDPFAVVTLLEGTNNRILGKTEVVQNSLSPTWTKTFSIDYSLGRERHFNVGVWDSSQNRRGGNKSMGSAMFEIGDVLGSPGSIKSKRLREGGILFVRVVKAQPSAGTLNVSSVRGCNLTNVEAGLFNKSDPFFTLSKKTLVRGESSWLLVYRSDFCKNNLNPKWGGFEIGLDQLCDGDPNQSILVSVFDYENSGRHTPMGTVDISANALVCRTATFTLRRNGKSAGAIEFAGAQIYGRASSASPATYASPVTGGSTYTSSAPSFQSPSRAPTFVDYISGGCELHMCVAIDFTGSNGNPRVPGTLHYIHPDGSLNEYEKALTAISSILMKYDSDKKIPVLGFGAKFHGVLNNCFQCGPTKEVFGINGTMEAYRSMLRTGLTLSGPTFFCDIIKYASARAAEDHEAAMRRGRQAYNVLLIITDGVISDINPTKRALVEGSLTPLSVVIIGVGNADFSAMQFLDDFMINAVPPARDIVQFVQFSRHSHDKSSLTAATLEEIPQQLVTYFTTRNMPPLPMMSTSQLNVTPDPYNEETDIDLSLDFKGEDEIVLLGNAPVINNTSYTLPPPVAPPSYASQSQQYTPNSAYTQQGSAPSAPYATESQQYSSSFTSPQQGSAIAVPSSYSSPAQQYSSSYASPQPVVAAATVPSTFRVQVPPGVNPGQQVQVQNPQTGQLMLVTVPQGVAPGGIFDVRS